MIGRYIHYAFRHLIKNKLFSLINIIGLAIGMASAIMILLWVRDELSFDRYHKNPENIFRVMENQYYAGGEMFTFAATPGVMAPKMKDDFPEISRSSRMTWEQNELFQHQGKSHYFKTRYVDQDFLDMFTFEILEGDLSSALSDHSSMVITQEVAITFFGKESALGKAFKVNNNHEYKVTAVIKNIPANSSYPFGILLPVEVFIEDNPWANEWYNNNLRTFLELQPGTDWEAFSNKIKNYIKENREETTNIELFLQPYSKIHLYSDFRQGKTGGGRIIYVRIFSVVGMFIIIIAAINFMNLATALSTQRAREVGIRKISGSSKWSLIQQFLVETLIIAFLALLITLCIVYLLLPVFNQLAEKKMVLDPHMIGWSVGLSVITGLLAGIYPAFYISRYRPSQVLKGEIERGSRASIFRKLMVIFQFTLSIMLIIATMVVFQQMKFIYHMNLGLDRENMIYFPLREDMFKHYEAIRNTLFNVEGVKNIAVTSMNPLDVGNSTSSVEWPGKDPEEIVLFSNFFIDYDFVETFGITMAAGRDFDRQYPSDSSNFIINEKAAEAMGFTTESIINQEITFWGDRTGRVVGVMNNFNFHSVHVDIEPLILLMDKEFYWMMHIRLDMAHFDNILAGLNDIQRTYAPNYPFEYEFLDESYAQMYQSEERISQLMNYFALIAIVISCLGLYGLAAYTTERRTKELGIRKVMGASLSSIVGLVSKEYFILVIVAYVIAFPLTWYLMEKWLIDFAFHIELNVLTFIMAVFVALFLVLSTVSYFAFKAACTNPVEALRYE